MLYIILLAWIASSVAIPIRPTPIIYYTPSSSQYVGSNYYPFIQYPAVTPALGKALQSIQTPNELIFYTQQVPTQQLLINTQQPSNIPVSRFTAPPDELVDAIYNWFAENNVELPPGANKRPEHRPDKVDSLKEQENIDNSGKPRTASEAEVLGEAGKSFQKKPITPEFKPGQRFYILNGQPQFVSDYQPVVPRVSPIIPQILTQNAIPDTRNILIFQTQEDPKLVPSLKQRKESSLPAQPQESTGKNIVFLRNNIQEQVQQQTNQQEQIKPVRYHSQNLKQQNYLFVPEPQQADGSQELKERLVGVREQTLLQGFPQQQLLFGRYLPQTTDVKSQQLLQQAPITQTPIHQTHYVPVEVVPPQLPIQPGQLQYPAHSQDVAQFNHQQLSFIHIPVDKNVQPPQYIKTLVPIQINSKSQLSEVPVIPLQNQQQRSSPKQVVYFQTADVQQTKTDLRTNVDDTKQEVVQNEQITHSVPPGVAALEFARYIANRQEDLFSDSVVVDAKTSDNSKEEETTEQPEEVPPEEPPIAQAQPSGVAIAGKGGVAASAPHGTAFAGDNGLAVASPQATAVGGPNHQEQEKKPKRT